MRTGFALTMYRSAAVPHRTAHGIACPAARSPILSLVAGIFFATLLAAQAQESIEPDILPSLAEPPPAPTELLPSTSAEPPPALPRSMTSIAPESLPSSEAALPSSEEAFPSSPKPWSSSMNYTGAYTSVVPAPVAAGPYGGGGTYNVFPAGETVSSGEARRFHYALSLTVRGVWDDNIFISHTNKVSDYYFAIEPVITIGVGDMAGRNRSYLRLDYMPSAILFVDHSDQDAFNQLIHLEGGYNSGRLTLTLSEDIALLESANLNASAPTRMNIFYTRLIANYALTGKISLQGELTSPIYVYPGHISDYT